MKKVTRRLIAMTLIIALLVSNTVYAVSSLDSRDYYDLSSMKVTGKLSEELAGLDDDDESPVRVIVELYNAPLIEDATAKGLEVEELDASFVDDRTDDMTSKQEEVVEAAEAEGVDIEVHDSYVNVFNGFAATLRGMDVEVIASNPLVKSVSASNVYERPEPQMVNSSFFTKSDVVHRDYGYTGEGMVVSIIDTGIDPGHKDFVLDEGVMPGLTETDVLEARREDGQPLPGMYFTEKVPYGYNYMDDTMEIRDLGLEASMHGMHVAGTVAANGEIKGVAPNAQVLAMKVFGNDPEFGSTLGDIIISAIDDSIALGADVMNLSLGSTASFIDETDPEQMAVTRAVENGILMSISAGNSSYSTDGTYGSLDLVDAGNTDIGVVGSPGLTAESLQVASINNFTYLYDTTVSLSDYDFVFNGYGKDEWDIEGTYELVPIGGSKLGYPEDYEGLDVSGKVVLVSRGAFSFMDKTINAAMAGAAGIIVYDHGLSQFYFNQGGWDVPFMKIDKEVGLELEDLLAAEGSADFEVSYGPDGEYRDPVTGQVSDFSSWGTTPDLSFKPEIAAPGGNIYSTLNDDEYGYMSGTSMAAPHVAGGSALMLERLEKDPMFSELDLSPEEKALLAKNILMNTATPVEGIDNKDLMNAFGEVGASVTDIYGGKVGYASPRQQGAGSMNLANAMKTNAVVVDAETGIAKVNLGELESGEFSFDLELTNYGDEDLAYILITNMQVLATFWGYNTLTPVEIPVDVTVSDEDGVYESSVPTIELAAFDSKTVTVSLSMDPDYAALGGMFNPNGYFIEGYVTFHTDDEALFVDVEEAFVEASMIQGQIASKEFDIATNEALILELEAEKAVLETTKAALLLELEDEKELNESYLEKVAAVNQAEAKVARAQRRVNHREETLAILLQGQAASRIYQEYLLDIQNNIEEYALEVVMLTMALEEAQAQRETMMKDGNFMGAVFLGFAIAVIEAELADALESLEAYETLLLEAELSLADTAFIEEVILRVRAELAEAEIMLGAAYAELMLAENQFTDDELASGKNIEEIIGKIEMIDQQIMAVNKEIAKAEARIAQLQLEIEALEEAFAIAAARFNIAIEAYYNALPLSVPYIGYVGDWQAQDAFDGTMYEDDGSAASWYEETLLFDSDTGDGHYLGYNPEDELFYAQYSAISPDGDGFKDKVVPIYSLMRNLKNITYRIEDAEGNVVINLGSKSEERKNWFDSGYASSYHYNPEFAWDGSVGLELDADGNVVPVMAEDGQYTYVIEGSLEDNDPLSGTQEELVKTLRFDFVIDTETPVIDDILYTNGDDVLEVIVSDQGVVDYIDTEGEDGIAFYTLVDSATSEEIAVSYDGLFNMDDLHGMGYNAYIYVEDYAGNFSETGTMVVNDLDVPDVNIDIEPYSIFNTREVTTYGYIYDVAWTGVTIDGNEVDFTSDNEFLYTATYEEDGPKEMLVEATDEVGNDYSYARKFFVDATAPVLTSEKDDLDSIVYVSSDTASYDLAVTGSDNFPDLVMKVNNSVVFTQEIDFYSYYDKLTPVAYTYTDTMDLDFGPNTMFFEVIDAAGTSVLRTVTVYRLEEGEANPDKMVASIEIKNGENKTLKVDDSFDLDLLFTLEDGTELKEYEDALITVNPEGIVSIDGTKVTATAVGTATLVVAADGVMAEIVITVAPSSTGIVTSSNNRRSTTAPIIIVDDQLAEAAPAFVPGPYLDGYPDGSFLPEGLIKRSEISKILYGVIANLEEGQATFSDVGLDHWAAMYIAAMEKAELVKGYEGGVFLPEANIKRGEMAAIISRIIDLLELEVPEATPIYTDIAEHWAKADIEKIYAYGIEIEDGATEFMPEALLTRAEAVVMINELMKLEAAEDAEISFTDVPVEHWAYEQIKAAAK